MTNIQLKSTTSADRVAKYLDTAFPIFFFLLAISFYLRTYDSAQVKITEVQMFGTILIALWLCKIFESGHWPLSKSQTLIVLPFTLIFICGVLSFMRSPLHWGSFDFFVRRVMYIGFAFIAATEMTSLHDFRRISKWLILALAVCTIYGFIQWVDFYFFPPGPPQVGIDKFVWRRAFGQRVFSTFGNPNFFSNFLVIMVPVMMGVYLRSRQFFIIPLIILTVTNIYWTGSKGPAMGLMAGTAVFAALLIRFFLQNRKAKVIIFSSAFLVVALLSGYVIQRVFFGGAITSLSFRVYTWLSTWEMINAKPVLGNGIGTFWVVYPAYRRPAIFHIEAKHNTETDHAENEHLEVWMDEGIVGMGLWLWMIGMISIGIYKALDSLTSSQPTRAGPGGKTERKYPEEVYYMIGFLSGFLGMLFHNNTDVSMRFVSSGAPFWLLAGLNAALIMHSPLPEKQSPTFVGKNQPLAVEGPGNSRQIIMRIARILTIIIVATIAIRIIREFDWCQGRDGWRNPAELPHFIVTWGIFLLCWSTISWWFVQIALNCTRLKSLFTLMAAVIIIVPFWGFFIADVDHNRAIFFSKQGMWTRGAEFDSRAGGFPPEYQIMFQGGEGGTIDKDSTFGKIVRLIFPDIFWRRYGIGGALEHYDEVNRTRPDFIMAYYFKGNVYNDWGSQFAQKTQEAFQRGDIAQAEIFRKETEKKWNLGLQAYDDTRKLGPNYVQMHHQVGTVHQKWGDFLNGLVPYAEKFGHKALAEEYRRETKAHWLKALEYYQLYYKIDPVYDSNYYRQAQIYIQLGDLEKAEQTYIDHIEGKECKKPYHQPFGGFDVPYSGYDRYDLGSPKHIHDNVVVSKPEAWIILGDFYDFIKKEPLKAETAYKMAVENRPGEMEIFRQVNIDFRKRLASHYQRSGQIPEAIAQWQYISKLNPQDPDVLRMMQPRPVK